MNIHRATFVFGANADSAYFITREGEEKVANFYFRCDDVCITPFDAIRQVCTIEAYFVRVTACESLR